MTFLTYGKHIGLPEKHSETCARWCNHIFPEPLLPETEIIEVKFRFYVKERL